MDGHPPNTTSNNTTLQHQQELFETFLQQAGLTSSPILFSSQIEARHAPQLAAPPGTGTWQPPDVGEHPLPDSVYPAVVVSAASGFAVSGEPVEGHFPINMTYRAELQGEALDDHGVQLEVPTRLAGQYPATIDSGHIMNIAASSSVLAQQPAAPEATPEHQMTHAPMISHPGQMAAASSYMYPIANEMSMTASAAQQHAVASSSAAAAAALGGGLAVPHSSVGGLPAMPQLDGLVALPHQQQLLHQRSLPPTLAAAAPPPPAAAAAAGTPTFQIYRQAPYTTTDLVHAGDQLLKEYLDPQANLLAAIKAGNYKQHQSLLKKIWSYIQSVSLDDADTLAVSSSGSSSVNRQHLIKEVPVSLPALALAGSTAAAGSSGLAPQHFLLQPPRRIGSERTRTVLRKPPAAVAADQGGSEARDSAVVDLYGIARDFSSYKSATPIAIGNGRYLVNVRQDIAEMYPGWQFRLWICAVKQQQQEELGEEQPEEIEPPDVNDPRYLLQDALLEGDLPTPGAVWQYNSSHCSIAELSYKPRRRKSRSAAETAATAANNSATATESLLLDVSVGWCVFQYMPRQQQQQRKVKVGSSPSAAADVSMKRSRSLPQDALQGSVSSPTAAADAPAAAGISDPNPATAAAGSSSGSSLGLLGSTMLPAAAAAATPPAPMQQATQQMPGQPVAPPQTPSTQAAAAAATAAKAQLTERLRQLELQANPSTPQTDEQLLAFFWPASNVAAAAAARSAASPAQAAAAKHDIQQRLLQHDVRDKFGRNVLHLVASCKPEDMDLSSLDISMYQLDILLDNPELLNKLQHQTNNNGATPLLLAATHGVPKMFNRLLAAADLDVMQQLTKSGWTVLHRLAHSAAVAADQETRQMFENSTALTMHRIRDLAHGVMPVAAVADQQQQQTLLQYINELITRLVNVPQPSGKYYKGREVLESVVTSQLPALLRGTQA